MMDPGRADYSVLQFRTYQEYLASFLSARDYRYMQRLECASMLVKLGYRGSNPIYERQEFDVVKQNTLAMLNPKIRAGKLYGSLVTNNDPALLALAQREEPNLLKKISTIIFLIVRQQNGCDVSGYMDYAESLRHYSLNMHGCTNWKGVFEGKVALRPHPSHLSYYDLHKKLFRYNDSENYQTLHIGQSMLFEHKGDHKAIQLGIRSPLYSSNCKRTMFLSPLLGTVVLYDHIVRKPV